MNDGEKTKDGDIKKLESHLGGGKLHLEIAGLDQSLFLVFNKNKPKFVFINI